MYHYCFASLSLTRTLDGLDIKIDIESDTHKQFSKSLERTEWILYIPVFIFTKLLIPVFSVVHKIMVLFFQGPGVGPTLVCKMVILKMMIYVYIIVMRETER